MAPSKDSPTLAESLKKRKLDRTDLQNEERRNRKKQKSKRKSLGEQNGEQIDTTPVAEGNLGSNSSNQDYIATKGQLIVKETSNGQLETTNSSWNVSKPIGGRMLDIDPIFSEDEV
jgi:NET1-associated nuclear protein 1 (U3 small nucleolar RNA-associated protein 17)